MRIILKLFTFYLLLCLAIFGCEDKLKNEISSMIGVPIIMGTDENTSKVMNSNLVEIQKQSKIVDKDNYLYVNDIRKGIHVINNTIQKSQKNGLLY